jgi:hypothetical protein
MGQCESIVKSNEKIVIAALLEGESVVDWYVRKDTPVTNEETEADDNQGPDHSINIKKHKGLPCRL